MSDDVYEVEAIVDCRTNTKGISWCLVKVKNSTLSNGQATVVMITHGRNQAILSVHGILSENSKQKGKDKYNKLAKL